LRTVAESADEPRPLGNFMRCSKAEERRVRRVAWRLKEEARLGRSSIEDYVKTLVAGVDLPASTVKSALDILERNRRLLSGKNPWVWVAAALWLALFKKLGLLTKLAEAASTTTASIRKAAGRMRV
jgi:transcription initiation factor TFIIIB Brf1 subunit/transcription initiation factor TFIIB